MRKAVAIAYDRCKSYPAFDRNRFLDAFQRGVKAEELGYDTYQVFTRAWADDNSVFLAGYLEGIASTREAAGTEYGVKRA
jgi:hypothetical protein